MEFILFLTQTVLFVLITIVVLIIIGRLWVNLSGFYHKNYTFFELTFIIIYSSEQAIFSILFYSYKQYADIMVGLFALVVITTVSIEKLMMNRRVSKVSTLRDKYVNQFQKLMYKNKDVLREHKRLKETYDDLYGYVNYLEKKLEKKR